MSAYALLTSRTRNGWLLSLASVVPNLNLDAAFLIYRRNALSLETRLAVAK